jgi:hypothetical protein
MSNKISIGVVLAQIDQAVVNDKPQTFQIKYRKMDGSIGEIRDAQKGVKHPKGGGEQSSSGSGGKFSYNIKESGTLLLYSQERNGTRAIKIDLIREFNGHTVFHS